MKAQASSRPRRESEGGRVYLLTGATGFLGKVLLEELVRRRVELGASGVSVLIRPKGARSAEERFWQEIVTSPCYARLPADWTRWVRVIEGTLDQPGLALDPSVRDEVRARTTHVVHAAASVEFGLPLADAARQNVATSLNLLDLARSCARLEKLVCVSTAFVTPHTGDQTPIVEALAPLPAPAEELYRSILAGTAHEADLLARSGHPNTYTLTKSLAEHLLAARCGALPLAIVRPSIISASRLYPFPGWIDSATGFAAFVILLGTGHMRAMVGDPETRLDLIPVDEVATRVLLACDGSGGPVIHHAVAGLERSATLLECWQRIHEFFSVHRIDRLPAMRYLGPPGPGFILAQAVYHWLPIAAAGAWSGRARRGAAQLLARLTYVNRAFRYFTRNSFDFRSSCPLDASFEPRAYVTVVSRGVHRHLLGREDVDWLLAGRRHPGHGGDLRWVGERDGTTLIRFAGWAITKVLRRCFERVTVDVPSFERAREAVPAGRPIVVAPSHRSYFDFVLCSYLFFARPDLGISLPYVAAAVEFGRIPLLGRLLDRLRAFYMERGEGREDPKLTRRVHQLIRRGETIEFFIEGQRSRSRRFLTPKRGLLRCLQATGEPCTLLPVALSYDRVPEEASFARELLGAPKPSMRLGPFLAWTLRALRGRVDLGRVHIACGVPIRLEPGSDVHAVSQEVIAQLAGATVSTTYHLRGFLAQHQLNGVDLTWLRSAIEERGGRVLESDLNAAEGLDRVIAGTLGNQFAHLFENEAVADERVGRLRRALFGPDDGPAPEARPEREPVA